MHILRPACVSLKFWFVQSPVPDLIRAIFYWRCDAIVTTTPTSMSTGTKAVATSRAPFPTALTPDAVSRRLYSTSAFWMRGPGVAPAGAPPFISSRSSRADRHCVSRMLLFPDWKSRDVDVDGSVFAFLDGDACRLRLGEKVACREPVAVNAKTRLEIVPGLLSEERDRVGGLVEKAEHASAAMSKARMRRREAAHLRVMFADGLFIIVRWSINNAVAPILVATSFVECWPLFLVRPVVLSLRWTRDAGDSLPSPVLRVVD